MCERFGTLSEPNVKPLATATLFNAAGNNVYGVALGWTTAHCAIVAPTLLLVTCVVSTKAFRRSREGGNLASLPHVDNRNGTKWNETEQN